MCGLNDPEFLVSVSVMCNMVWRSKKTTESERRLRRFQPKRECERAGINRQ